MNDDDLSDDDNEPASRASCVDCGADAPPTNTRYTLISSEHGWRLRRGVHTDGVPFIEWRCPECWKTFKDARNATSSTIRVLDEQSIKRAESDAKRATARPPSKSQPDLYERQSLAPSSERVRTVKEAISPGAKKDPRRDE